MFVGNVMNFTSFQYQIKCIVYFSCVQKPKKNEHWWTYFEHYPVQYGSPALHSDALEDSQHGETNVVEAGDAVVWSLPAINADRDVGVTYVSTKGRFRLIVCVAWIWQFALLHDLI